MWLALAVVWASPSRTRGGGGGRACATLRSLDDLTCAVHRMAEACEDADEPTDRMIAELRDLDAATAERLSRLHREHGADLHGGGYVTSLAWGAAVVGMRERNDVLLRDPPDEAGAASLVRLALALAREALRRAWRPLAP